MLRLIMNRLVQGAEGMVETLERVRGLAHAGSASMANFFYQRNGLFEAPTLFLSG
jgi:hypothetical protein